MHYLYSKKCVGKQIKDCILVNKQTLFFAYDDYVICLLVIIIVSSSTKVLLGYEATPILEP